MFEEEVDAAYQTALKEGIANLQPGGDFLRALFLRGVEFGMAKVQKVNEDHERRADQRETGKPPTSDQRNPWHDPPDNWQT